jgi:hypothetical protein
MANLRMQLHPGEHMEYLLRNGYTEDAKRLFESQFSTGVSMRRLGVPAQPFDAYAVRLGYQQHTDEVDTWLWHFFNGDDTDVEASREARDLYEFASGR